MTNSGQVMKDQGVKVTLAKAKGVEINLDSVVRTFKFDLNALCVLQDSFPNIDDAFKGLQKMDFKIIRTLVHAVLASDEDDSFTTKEAGSLVTLENIHEVAEALGKALEQATPENKGTGKK